MAKKKKSVPTQAQRLLEMVRKTRADRASDGFARSTGKTTLARNSRKPGKGEIGGSNV